VQRAESSFGDSDEHGEGFLVDQGVIAKRGACGPPSLPQQLPEVRLRLGLELVQDIGPTIVDSNGYKVGTIRLLNWHR
jgi:hypothetical protein